MLAPAISNGEVIIVVVLIVIPIAAIAFAGAGAVYKEIGKGAFAMDHDRGGSEKTLDAQASRAVERAEIRQMLEAKAYRQRTRGEEPLDVEEEMQRLLAPKRNLNLDPSLVDEVRQLVLARNKRRIRQGKEPLDVDEEIARQLSDLESLGQ